MSNLTDKQQAFVNEYLKSWNATDAALKAGYSQKTAYSIGHENLKKPEIESEIQRRIETMTMTADEALIRLGKQARGSMEDFITIIPHTNMPMIDWQKANDKGVMDLVKKISIEEGKITFELHDSQSALKEILRQLHLKAGEPTENSSQTIKIVYPDDK